MPENSEKFKRFQQLLGQSTLDVFKNIGPPIETINIDQTSFSSWGESKNIPKQYPLAIGIKYQEGLSGELWFVFSLGIVDRIARAFLEQGLKELGKITAECVDAVAEVANQITGSLNVGLKKLVGSELNVSPPSRGSLPDILKSIDSNYLAGECKVVLMELDEAKKESIVVLGDAEFARSLESKLLVGSEKKDAVETKESGSLPEAEKGNENKGSNRPGLEGADARNIDLILDINLDVVLRIGSKLMPLNDILDISSGTVIELDKSVSDPVDVIVNNKMIARGEIVVVEGNYGIKITEIATKMDRIRSLG